jgi:hypothetical protein
MIMASPARRVLALAAAFATVTGVVLVACMNDGTSTAPADRTTSAAPVSPAPAGTEPSVSIPAAPGVTPTPTPAPTTTPPAPNPAPAIAPPAERTPFEIRALAIAAEYQAWGRVDDELRWAPGLCRLPLPGVAYMSESKDAGTHGSKLYSVFARHRAAYPAGPDTDQVVVKESWTAEPVTDPGVKYAPPSLPENPSPAADHFYPYAKKGDALYHAGARAGLYIMFKVDPAPADSDGGWIYATITAAGQLTAAGRIQSCIGCHQEAEHDRLFGVHKALE